MTPASRAAGTAAETSAKKEPAAAAERRPSAPALIIHRLELTPDAQAQTIAVADRFGMTQIAALSRLVEWFAGQSAEVQAAVLSGTKGKSGDVARMILEPIAKRA